ncbi:MAG: TetR/AcrR family transcriptional regulator [Calditrichaeota bacterium]|nr:MAG: TetR/AcrR family transcriptional regulator [Calditrichota bacterium]
MKSKELSRADVVDKRMQILCAAQRCFARYGFAKTTLDDIAAGVGMKKASLYYYYKNKESIFQDVIEYESNELLNLLNEKMATCSNAIEKLLMFAHARLEYLRKTINLHELSVQVLLEVKPIIDRLFQDFQRKQLEVLQKILLEGIEQNIFKQIDVNQTASAILSVLEAVVLKEFQSAEIHSASDIDYNKLQKQLDTILTLMIDGLKK